MTRRAIASTIDEGPKSRQTGHTVPGVNQEWFKEPRSGKIQGRTEVKIYTWKALRIR